MHFRKIGIKSGIYFWKIGIRLGIHFRKIGSGYVFDASMARPRPKSGQLSPAGNIVSPSLSGLCLV